MTPKETKKEKKLNELQRKHRELMQERLPIQKEYKEQSRIFDKVRRRYEKKTAEIKAVGQQIFDMKHDGETPHVTDHALIRYLERVEGVDIWALKTKVAADKNAVREGNVIVTVNEDLEDQ